MSANSPFNQNAAYRMRQRAEQVAQTRQRIVEAAVRLHTTLGPANTTVAALAEEAGVTRLTVYRHFPDEEGLFVACGQHWNSQHPAPDPASWREISDAGTRARHGLRALYGWYRDHHDDLLPLYRDVAAMPPAVQEAMHEEHRSYAEALVKGTRASGHARRRLRAAAGHVVSFWTWQSLAVVQNLDDGEAADLSAELLAAAVRRGRPRR